MPTEATEAYARRVPHVTEKGYTSNHFLHRGIFAEAQNNVTDSFQTVTAGTHTFTKVNQC